MHWIGAFGRKSTNIGVVSVCDAQPQIYHQGMQPSEPHGASPASLRDDAKVIGLVGVAHASSHFSQLILPVMFPVFIREFGLSYAQLGLLMSMFFVVSGVGQASAGFLVDRWGARPVMFGSLATFAVACLVASAAGSYAALLFVAALLGLGNSPFHPVDFTIMNQRVSPARLGYAFSVHGVTGNLGWAAAPVFFATLSSLWHWRAAYGAAAVLYLGILVLLVLHRDHIRTTVVAQPQGPAAASRQGGDLAFLRLPVVWCCFGFFLFSTTVGALVQSFSVSLLGTLHGISFETATANLTVYMLCGAAGMLAGGVVAARTPDSDRVVALCMGAAACLLLLCGLGMFRGVGTMVVLAAAGLAIGLGGPSRDMMIKRATPAGATGRVYGMVYSGMDVGLAISPLILGLCMDHGWYQATFFFAALSTLVAVGFAVGVGQRTGAPRSTLAPVPR